MADSIQFSSRGVKLQGQLHHYTSAPPSQPAIAIILTGDSPSGTKSKTWAPMISTLTSSGISVFAFDFHSQGFSEGDRSSLSIGVGCQNFLDAMSALKAHVDISRHRIGLLGSSFGAAVLLLVHERVKPYHAIALKSPASFLAESYETEHGFPDGMNRWKSAGISPVTGLHYRAYLEALEYNVYPSAMKIEVPVLIVHGTSDSIVPIIQSRRLQHLIGPGAKLLEQPGVNHDYKQPGAQDALQQAIRSFFVEHLVRHTDRSA